VSLPDRALDFYSWPRYEEDWIEEGRRLEFRCELQSTDPDSRRPVRARLRARLAVSWVAVPRLSWIFPTGFVLNRVEDLDFAVELDGKRVFDVCEVRPKQDGKSLLFSDRSGRRARIVDIVYDMDKSLNRMTRSRQTPTS
jgi:hypothetical protein